MQRNKFVSLLRKSKEQYYENFDEKKLVTNKYFCKTVKTLLSGKSVARDKKIST